MRIQDDLGSARLAMMGVISTSLVPLRGVGLLLVLFGCLSGLLGRLLLFEEVAQIESEAPRRRRRQAASR